MAARTTPSWGNRRRRKGRYRVRRRRTRRPLIETLEDRRVLAPAVWHNVFDPPDVTGDRMTTPLDILTVATEVVDANYQDPSTGQLVHQIPDGTRPPYYDVNCDAYATPLDVLFVVTDVVRPGNGGGSGPGDGSGTFPHVACSPHLVEGTDFVTEFSRKLTLPDDSSAVQVLFRAPQFDTATVEAVRDAVEIEITDADGNPLSLPSAPGRDAVFNWTEGYAAESGSGTTVETGGADQDWTATVNLSGVPAGSDVWAHVRLVNNDQDDTTSLIVRGFEIVDAPTLPPVAPSTASPTPDSIDRIDPAQLTDLTGSFPPSYGHTALDGANDQLVAELQVTNNSPHTITGQLVVAVGNISTPDAFALHPDGFLPDGRPFFDLSGHLPGGVLRPGETATTREIEFLNQSDGRFDYRLSTLGKINRGPSRFDSQPPALIEAGRAYRYAANAVDPDGDPLVYSVDSGPDGLTIDPHSGSLEWTTTAADVGNHTVVLRATDPYGLAVTQTLSIEVAAVVQNRPPIFTSTPETEAIAASGFEVSTVGVGANPAGIALADIGVDRGQVVTINPGSQTISQRRSLPHDNYAAVAELSVGEPHPTGDLLRGGFNVNPGLPVYKTTIDSNRLSGFDQADLNGDGHLDFVSNVWFVQDQPTRTYSQQLVVNYADGNGNFGDAVVLADLGADSSSDADFTTLAAGDFDNNGANDILTLNTRTETLYYLAGHGDGTFEPLQTQVSPVPLESFKTIDLDQDGVLDLLARSGNSEIGWLQGNGDGTFADYETLAALSPGYIVPNPLTSPRLYDAGDVDHDGDIDLAVVDNSTRDVVVFTNDGSMGFTEQVRLAVIRPESTSSRVWSTYLELADFDGDGHSDIAAGTYSGVNSRVGGVITFLGDGTVDGFTYQVGAAVTSPYPGNSSGTSGPTDLDGDGDLDLVVASVWFRQNGYLPTILLNRGDGTFEATSVATRSNDQGIHQADTDAVATTAVVGDYNEDGLVDVAFARSNLAHDFSIVTVLLAETPGRFAAGTTTSFSQGGNSYHSFFESGDFNNDGYLDIWSPAYQSVSRTWFGDGSGTYSDDRSVIATPYIGNEFLRPGLVEDLDRDGNLDVVWLGNGGVQGGPGPRVLVGMGNGDGTFTITFAGGGVGTPGIARAGDFNEDGFIDIATRSHGPQVDVWLYDPSDRGTFIRSQTFPLKGVGINVNGYYTALAVDDFDQDGHLDMATVDREQPTSGPHKLVTWYGRGDGTFDPAVEELDFFGNPDYTVPYFADAGDFNEDGLPDLVTYEYYGLSVHINNGQRGFDLPVYYPGLRTSRALNGLYVRDLDGDGHQDIIFTDSLGAGQIGVMRGRGDGTFFDRETYDSSFAGGYLTFADFDNDSHLDVLSGTSSFAPIFTTILGARPGLSDLLTLDINGDGNDDAFAVNTDNSRIKWFLGNNLGELTRQPDLLTDFSPVAIGTADFNGDSQTELFTVNHSGSSVSLFTGSVDTGFTRTDLDVGVGPVDGTAEDVTGDGRIDLLVIDDVRNALWVLPGNGDLTFGTPVPVALGDKPAELFVADADGDGNLDALISLPDSDRVMILPGDGSGGFDAPVYLTLPGIPSDVAGHDFNDDGNLDIAVTIEETDELAIFFGRGALQFAQPQLIQVGQSPSALRLGDADDDGRVDLLVANSGDNTASIVYNRFDPTEVYRYHATAVDPDDDPVTYSILEGPGGLVLNAVDGSLLWAPSADQVGPHRVTLEADDGRGGTATQSFVIDVRPARENHSPIIAGEPATTVAADEVFSYNVAARDGDGDPLRYRLLEGPAGATLDPTTGQLQWTGTPDGALEMDPALHNKVVAPHSPSLELTDATLETWFKFDGYRSNGAQYLISKGSNTNVSYSLVLWVGQLRAEIGDGTTTGIVRAAIPFTPELDRWYHFAMTFDDAAGELRLFVDGEQVASTNTDQSIVNTETPLQVGAPTGFYGPDGTFDNTRVWNVARTPEQIREGMSRQYDNDPTLVLDYRFEPGEQLTVVDHSPYHNDGIVSG